MKLGYGRVSTKDQHEERQKKALMELGIEERFIFIDKASGRNFNREKYALLKLMARPGDTIYIYELDRLGRNKTEVLKELEYFRSAGIELKILDIPTTMMDLSQYGEMAANIVKMVNALLVEVMATFAEQELKKLDKRRSEGIAAAKLKGVKFGRPRIPLTDEFKFAYEEWRDKNIPAVKLMAPLHLKPGVFYKLAKEYETTLPMEKRRKKKR